MLRGLKACCDRSVPKNDMGSVELTVFVKDDLGLQNLVKILAVYQIKICSGEIFIYRMFKKKRLKVRYFQKKNYWYKKDNKKKQINAKKV